MIMKNSQACNEVLLEVIKQIFRIDRKIPASTQKMNTNLQVLAIDYHRRIRNYTVLIIQDWYFDLVLIEIGLICQINKLLYVLCITDI